MPQNADPEWVVYSLWSQIGFGFKFYKQPPEVFCKKGVIKIWQNSQENTCAKVFFLLSLQTPACNFIKNKDYGTGVFLWTLSNF